METKYFSLSISENNRLVKIFRLIFGIVCVAIGLFWMIINIKSLKTDKILWVTIIFISGFGSYQIWAGLGLSDVFIETSPASIRLKKNPVLPPIKMIASEIEKIELFPLNMIFRLKSGKKINLRLGTTYPEINSEINDAIIAFADSNNIILDLKSEQI